MESVLFDRYELLEPAGRGGSAEVWRALDRETGEIVAVKRLHPVVFADEAGRHRLEREFRLLRDLDEPHIVRVRDLEIGDREAALILDYVAGASLADRLAGDRAAGHRMEPVEAVAIVEDVAAALSAAHAAGLVHRDVTPGNILLGADGLAHLTDFGIAQASDDLTAVTADGMVLGTMRFLAPEQLRGEPATPASDLHGLAAVAWEMVTGRPAYEASTPVALVEAQRTGPEPVDGLPAELDRAIRAGLDPDPARRPRDVGAFAASLSRAVGSTSRGDDRTVAIALPLDGRASERDPGPARGAAEEPVRADVVPPSVTSDRAPGSSSRPRARTGSSIPGPVVAGLGLVLAIVVLAAASGLDGSAPVGAVASPDGAAATPTRTAKPAPTPKPKDPGKRDHGNGHGKGNDG